MQTIAKLAVLVILLNLVRYVIGGPIENLTIMEPMHRVMPENNYADPRIPDLLASKGYEFHSPIGADDFYRYAAPNN